MINGVLNLYKPKGMTSHNVVSFVRRTLKIKRVGHAGTLDPIACGVLPVMLGSAAKLSEILTNHDKTYAAKIRLGITTDTQDTTGNILTESAEIPSEDKVKEAVLSFTGKILQIPPMYSAIKVNGKKLYDLAREGKEIEREPRQIQVYNLNITPTDKKEEYILTVDCSKGTYIRTLCHDIGEKLGCGAAMTALERTKCGEFDISESITLEEMEKNADQISDYLITAEKILERKYAKKIMLDSFNYNLIRNGAHVLTGKITDTPENFNIGDKALIYGEAEGFFALGEIIEEDGVRLKSSIIF